MASIDIPDDEIADLLSVQILSALTQKTREDLIKAALQHLLKPDYSSYGSRKSPMQEAFDRAIVRVANGVADEVLVEEGVRDSVKDGMRRLITEIPDFDTDWDMQTAIFRAIIQETRKKND